jgi:hypothetical protein
MYVYLSEENTSRGLSARNTIQRERERERKRRSNRKGKLLVKQRPFNLAYVLTGH